MPCRHSVLIDAIQYAAESKYSGGFGAPLTSIRTIFNCLAPLIASPSASVLFICKRRSSFAVYRLADTFRFATSISVDCDEWPTADLRRMLTEEIDVVQRLGMLLPLQAAHLEILLDLPHLESIHVPPLDPFFFFLVRSKSTCAPLVRLFQQTTSRSLRRSIGLAVGAATNAFSDPELFAPLMLDALLGAETVIELYALLFLAMRVPGFPRQHEVDHLTAILSDYKNNFADLPYVVPLGVVVATYAACCHAALAVHFDFEPFFEYIWGKYYETRLIDELVKDKERARGEEEEPFKPPYQLTIAAAVVKNLFDGMTRDAADASRGDVCIDAFFGSDSYVNGHVNDLFRDERLCNVVSEGSGALTEYDDKMVALCCTSFSFASRLSNFVAAMSGDSWFYSWCGNLQTWAEHRAAHTTRLIHRQGEDRATAEKMVEAERSAWNSIYDARLIAATLMFGSTDLLNPPHKAVEATQDLLYDLFDEDNDVDDARLIPAFTAVLTVILLMPPDKGRDDNGEVMRTIPVLDQDCVKDVFTFLTHAARRERMRIKRESVAADDDNSNDRRRSREQSEAENSNYSYRRYLPRLLEDNHLRQLMEREAARGTAVVKDLLDELVIEEVIEI